MHKISVAIATHNEEANIRTCLDSVKDWVDEIVIVDGASNDKTIDLIKKYKVKLIRAKNEKMFHINKQLAIDGCKMEWILQLDADEIVTDSLRTKIVKILNPHHTTHNQQPISGYWIPRRNYFLGKFLSKGGQFPDYSLRLYLNGKGRLPCKSVHEQAVVEGKTEFLTEALLHFPYPNFSHYLEHFNLYTDIFSKELLDKNIQINVINTLFYMIIKPKFWFLTTFIRHKGFIDGFPGLVFSLFSSLRFPVAYIKFWEIKKAKIRNQLKSV